MTASSRFTISLSLVSLTIFTASHRAFSQPGASTQPAPMDPNQARLVVTQTRLQLAGLLLADRPVGEYVQSANEQFYEGAWDQAMVQYLLAERIKPGNFHARYQLARIFSGMGQSELCARWFRDAVDSGFSQHALARTDPA